MAPACEEKGIIGDLQNLVDQLDNGGGDNCSPCPPIPCSVPAPAIPVCPEKPVVEACMTCPPPILAPTVPCPVNPLKLPCCKAPSLDIIPENNNGRYANYYNNYNIDWRNPVFDPLPPPKRRNCESYELPRKSVGQHQDGCPTGFKPCAMAMTATSCHPCAPWIAEVQPCPPKPRKRWTSFYTPRPCTRPCCKHWMPKEPPCVYDDPCRAHCFNHPIGIKPSGRFP